MSRTSRAPSTPASSSARWGLGYFAPEVPLRFLAELDDHATRFGNVLVTGEGLSKFLWTVDPQVLAGFQALARRHAVRVAYYVRPQTHRGRGDVEGGRLPAVPGAARVQ